MELKDTIRNLPPNPGVYKYFDASDTIIYVGKAKNLKKRVSSYFVKQHDNHKTRLLVKKIKRIEYVVVNNEADALLLENNLIKEHQPRYNMLLKDDKSFPLIRITNERFPKVYAMRNPVYDGSEYYGPYTSARAMRTILDLIKSIYPIRNCNYNLSEENISKGKYKVCLEYQIGNCNGPCAGLESEEEYMHSIAQVRQILRGYFGDVKSDLKAKMDMAAEDLRFEEAAKYKHKLDLLEMFKTRSTVVSHKISDVDVFSCIVDHKKGFVNGMKVVNGMIVQAKTIEYNLKLAEDKHDVLARAIPQLRQDFASDSKEIILAEPVELMEDINITIPKAGDKRKLLDLSIKNVLLFKKQKIEQYDKLNPDHRVERIMQKMKEDLRLKEEPRHMECFDNSNLQGTNPVSACVVFHNGKPAKKEYRHFNIKTVEGPNDFDSMKEVVYRRYTRLLKENKPLPQLIIIDGGKGQLSSVVETMKEIGIYDKVAVVGIAKRLEEIFYPGDQLPLYIDKTSETLKIIQHMRDEAHRFGITHHRNKRSKAMTTTALAGIPGIGPKMSEKLLTKYRSVKKIKSLSEAELIAFIGPSKGKLVYKYFKDEGKGH